MNINLNNSEIVQAITDYIATLGLNLKNKDVEVRLIAGRGSNGHSAQIDVKQSENIEEEDMPFDFEGDAQ